MSPSAGHGAIATARGIGHELGMKGSCDAVMGMARVAAAGFGSECVSHSSFMLARPIAGPSRHGSAHLGVQYIALVLGYRHDGESRCCGNTLSSRL